MKYNFSLAQSILKLILASLFGAAWLIYGEIILVLFRVKTVDFSAKSG